MFNKLKHILNEKLNTNFKVKVLVYSPDKEPFISRITGSIRNSELIILEGYGLPESFIVDSYVKVNDVYHIESNKGFYIVRVL